MYIYWQLKRSDLYISLAPPVYYVQNIIFFFMVTKEISIGSYIVRRLKEQGVKVSKIQNVRDVYSDFDLDAAVYFWSPRIVSFQFSGMSHLVSSKVTNSIELPHVV